MKIAIIIPAAGLGKRFAASQKTNGANKIELDLAGKPVFLRTIELFLGRDNVSQVILAVNPDRLEDFRFRWGDKLGFLDVTIVPGGTLQRWETVHKAIEHVDADATHIAVHDAARPLGSAQLIDRVFAAAEQFDAVIPALPINATLKRITGGADDQPGPTQDDEPLDAILGSAGKTYFATRKVVDTIDRNNLVEVQTPQVFGASLLRRAYAQLPSVADGTLNHQSITDDASLVEALGQTVYVVEGESTNLKITTASDAELALAIIEKRDADAAKDIGEKRLFADEEE